MAEGTCNNPFVGGAVMSIYGGTFTFKPTGENVSSVLRIKMLPIEGMQR